MIQKLFNVDRSVMINIGTYGAVIWALQGELVGVTCKTDLASLKTEFNRPDPVYFKTDQEDTGSGWGYVLRLEPNEQGGFVNYYDVGLIFAEIIQASEASRGTIYGEADESTTFTAGSVVPTPVVPLPIGAGAGTLTDPTETVDFTRYIDDGAGGTYAVPCVQSPEQDWTTYGVAEADLAKGAVAFVKSGTELGLAGMIKILPRNNEAGTKGYWELWYYNGTTWVDVARIRAAVYKAELAPALVTPNWTLGAGWAYGTLNKNADGTGTAQPATAIPVVAGQIYQVTITLSACTVGNCTYTLGGTAGTTLAAAKTYTDYITAATTGNLIFSPSATGARFTISAVTVRLYQEITASSVGPKVGPRFKMSRGLRKALRALYPATATDSLQAWLHVELDYGRPFVKVWLENACATNFVAHEIRIDLVPTDFRYWTRLGVEVDAQAAVYGLEVDAGDANDNPSHYLATTSGAPAASTIILGMVRKKKADVDLVGNDAGNYWNIIQTRFDNVTVTRGQATEPVWIFCGRYDQLGSRTGPQLALEALARMNACNTLVPNI